MRLCKGTVNDRMPDNCTTVLQSGDRERCADECEGRNMSSRQKVRTIYTNDGECDDMNTFLHQMLYLNDLELEGIVYSCSCFHYEGIPEKGIAPKRWAAPEWMGRYMDSYEEIYPNLRAQDPDYPTPEYLRSITAIGNVKYVSEMEEVTPGSELIRKAILKEDSRKLYIQIGGGTSTVARALKSIEEEYRGTDQWEKIYRQVSDKLVIVMIVTQDETYKDYISVVWPEVELIHCMQIMPVAFLYGEKADPPEALECFSGRWMQQHLLSKSSYMQQYHTWLDGHVYPGEEWESQFGSNPELAAGNWWGKAVHQKYDMISEGDSPSFLYLLDRGLRSLENPAYGGWGGRYERKKTNEFHDAPRYYLSCEDLPQGIVEGDAFSMSRWVCDWMNDFAARASWTNEVDYNKVNHMPELVVEGGCDRNAAPGEEVEIRVKAADPGDTMTLSWWRYQEADTCRKEILLHQSQNEEGTCGSVRFRVPAEAGKGENIHLILTCRDAAHGEFPEYMTTYARVIITVS